MCNVAILKRSTVSGRIQSQCGSYSVYRKLFLLYFSIYEMNPMSLVPVPPANCSAGLVSLPCGCIHAVKRVSAD